MRGLCSRLITNAGPVTFSSRASFTKRSSGWPGSISTAVGTFRKWGRMRVRPAARSRMAARRWPSKVASSKAYGQPGDGVPVQMPYSPPTKRTSSATLPPSWTPARPEPIRNSTCDVKQCCAYFARTPTAPALRPPISRSTLLSAE